MVGEKKKNIIFEIYRDSRTVFRINDIAILINEVKDSTLSKKLFYYVQTGKLLNPRKGFYAKIGYNPEEFACLLYTPTYISLEYVLQQSGVIFQFSNTLTNVSYLSREVEIDNYTFRYRQIKGEILINTSGIFLNKNNINTATTERAFLDMLYLDKDFYFDNLHVLDKKKLSKLLPLYKSQTLNKTVSNLLSI